jgi:hypothetical protein
MDALLMQKAAQEKLLHSVEEALEPRRRARIRGKYKNQVHRYYGAETRQFESTTVEHQRQLKENRRRIMRIMTLEDELPGFEKVECQGKVRARYAQPTTEEHLALAANMQQLPRFTAKRFLAGSYDQLYGSLLEVEANPFPRK